MHQTRIQLNLFTINFNINKMENLSNQCGKPFNSLQYCFGDKSDSIIMFGHGLLNDSRNAQIYSAKYCSKNWNKICEIASMDNDTNVINLVKPNTTIRLSRGQILIRNTAIMKYMIGVFGAVEKKEYLYPQDSTSPIVTYWSSKNELHPMHMEFSVNPYNIDSDPVMNKILEQPHIAIDILQSIHKNMKKTNNLRQLNDTKLGSFFMKHF